MNKFNFVSSVQGLSILAVALVACGGAPEPSSEGADKTTKVVKGTTTDPTDPVEPAAKGACSVAGDKGNTLGIGKFCSKTVDECAGGTFCQAAFAPEGAQFCTMLCSTDSQCGDGAVCFKEARGSACVPNKCLEK